jgi:hypothetical protein
VLELLETLQDSQWKSAPQGKRFQPRHSQIELATSESIQSDFRFIIRRRFATIVVGNEGVEDAIKELSLNKTVIEIN